MSAAREAERERRGEFRSYAVGYGLALLLTLVPFALVAFAPLARVTLLWIIAGCAAAQAVVHFRCFLHVSFSHKREDLQLILFSTLILFLMVGGTIWILGNLHARMMPGM